MEVYRDAWEREDLPRELIATVGNFDGIHLGQQRILGLVTDRARETGLTPAVVTFEPHPLAVLRPERAPAMLTTGKQKEELLAELGVAALVELRFTPRFSGLPARRFVRDFLVERLAVRELYVGSRFSFGRDREGDLSLLRGMGESFGFTAFGVEELVIDGAPVSSTRIRAALAGGGTAEAQRLLGRPYALSGLVARGDGRGRGLGWPTVNLAATNELLVADGVYVSQVSFPALGGGPRPAVTNVGRRPTIHDHHPRLVESHLLDFDREVYGERVQVELLDRLRGERRFGSLDELRRQIGRDVEAAREYFVAAGCYQEREPRGS